MLTLLNSRESAMTSDNSASSTKAETESIESGLIDLRNAPLPEKYERARQLFAEACSSSPLYQARLARDPEYFKRCSPGRFLWPKKAT